MNAFTALTDARITVSRVTKSGIVMMKKSPSLDFFDTILILSLVQLFSEGCWDNQLLDAVVARGGVTIVDWRVQEESNRCILHQ